MFRFFTKCSKPKFTSKVTTFENFQLYLNVGASYPNLFQCKTSSFFYIIPRYL